MTGVEIITAYSVIAGLLAAFGLGVIAGHQRWRTQRRTIRRLTRSVEHLSGLLDDAEDDLAAERALIDRITGTPDDITHAPRGAHHRPEEARTDG